jgi:hypothetical protein
MVGQHRTTKQLLRISFSMAWILGKFMKIGTTKMRIKNYLSLLTTIKKAQIAIRFVLLR